MSYFINAFYIVALIVLSPYLIYKALTTGKYRRGLWRKITGRIIPAPLDSDPAKTIWFHGVSVGEIVMLQTVVSAFRHSYPDWRCVVSTTTDTGFAEATNRFPDATVVYWAFDFSWAVGKALSLIHPRCVVLAESELWPNFVRIAQRRGVKIALVNGRMSPKSAKRFRLLRWLVGPTFQRIDMCATQTEEIARNFIAAGVAPDRIVVTGSVKYDGVEFDRGNPSTQELRRLFKITDDDLVWVAGSTQAPEEQIVLEIFDRIKFPKLRLVIVPRQQDRFEEVAHILRESKRPFVRRSELPSMDRDFDNAPVILVDTIGELGALWGFAEIAFVGGSLDGKRGGQNMIEPAAFGAAVTFGPHTWNFRDTVRLLLSQNAAIEAADAIELGIAIRELVRDETTRRRLGDAAKQLVLSQQGAASRTVDALRSILTDRRIIQEAA